MVKEAVPAPADLNHTVLSVIKGGMLRVREVHYPPLHVTPVVLFKDWFPNPLDYLIARTIPDGTFNEQREEEKKF